MFVPIQDIVHICINNNYNFSVVSELALALQVSAVVLEISTLNLQTVS